MLKSYFRYLCHCLVAIAFSSANAGPADDFFHAVNVDNPRTVSAMLAQGFDPNTVSEKGQVGLYLALRDGSPKVAAALLASPRIVIDAPNAADETPVMMAALRGELDWTRKLLDRGALVNRPGWTPFHYAAAGPEAKVVALLIERGADIEALSPNRTTPLMMAARYGAEESALLLLARGAKTQVRNDAGMNAIDFAKSAARESLARRLEQGSK